MDQHPWKISLMNLVLDIKLIRTNTTLDLSQKAEKGMLSTPTTSRFIHHRWHKLLQTIWENATYTFISLLCVTTVVFGLASCNLLADGEAASEMLLGNMLRNAIRFISIILALATKCVIT